MSDLPKSFDATDKMVQKGSLTPFKDTIRKKARASGADPNVPAGQRKIVNSRITTAKGPAAQPLKPVRSQADLNKALDTLQEHALPPEKAGRAAKRSAGRKSAVKAVKKAARKGKLPQRASNLVRKLFGGGSKKAHRAAPGIFKKTGLRILGIAGKGINIGFKILGAIALPLAIASIMYDDAEASSGAPQSEIIWMRLKEAYDDYHVPPRERLKNLHEFSQLSLDERKALLNKYSIDALDI